MAAKRIEKVFPMDVIYGNGKVRIRVRTDGLFDLAWREMGSQQRTTKTDETKALEWADKKARALDGGTGQRWISRGDAETLTALKRLAGSEDESARRKLVEDLEGALGWLDGKSDLTTACRWFAEFGPLKIERTSVAAAITRFLAEYKNAPKPTRMTFTTELSTFAKRFPELMLMDLTHDLLETWCKRKTRDKGLAPAPKTKLNRITTWCTFLTRSRDWNLLPPGKHAGELLRRPVIPDAGKEIFTVDQGRRLLAAVRKKEPKLIPYLLIGGWLGLRPSEIQRLTWEAFEWDRNYLHVTVQVAGKNSSERYVHRSEIDPAAACSV